MDEEFNIRENLWWFGDYGLGANTATEETFHHFGVGAALIVLPSDIFGFVHAQPNFLLMEDRKYLGLMTGIGVAPILAMPVTLGINPHVDLEKGDMGIGAEASFNIAPLGLLQLMLSEGPYFLFGIKIGAPRLSKEGIDNIYVGGQILLTDNF